ncbi:response regulator [Sphingomonas lycopersici]|uniref:Response regulator transcription factor n=1 Tax=Sphingomonas lycopersici TaxID=2951807 RepID=A0AA41ZBQ4_9SPHN|nr:response regulator transcription factor [Sphingomonas lycopersici]
MQDGRTALSPTLIVEDDPAIQFRIRRLVRGIEGPDAAIDIAATLAEARALLVRSNYALALIDIGLPDGNGCDLIAELHEREASTQTVVISAWGSESVVINALRSGAIGYLLKEREDVELDLLLRSIQRGGAPIDPAIARQILTFLPAEPNAASAPQASTSQITTREREILHLVSLGRTNREIADELCLSRLTIETHAKTIYRKLAVSSRTAAVFKAKSLGLLG